MFIVHCGTTYEVTRSSVIQALRKQLRKSLCDCYNEEFLDKVLDEIIQKMDFPSILDSQKVFVNDSTTSCFTAFNLGNKPSKEKKKYTITDFFPTYNGPIIDEVQELYEDMYHISTLFYDTPGYDTALITQYGDSNFGIVSMAVNPKHVIANSLTELLTEATAYDVATDISRAAFEGVTVYISVIQNNDVVYYAITNKNNLKRSKVFSCEQLKKSIMNELPELDCITNAVSDISVFLHNKLVYNCVTKMVSRFLQERKMVSNLYLKNAYGRVLLLRHLLRI